MPAPQLVNITIKEVPIRVTIGGGTGPAGPEGPAGTGLPTGGADAAIVVKASGADFDFEYLTLLDDGSLTFDGGLIT